MAAKTKASMRKTVAHYMQLPYTFTLLPDPYEKGYAIQVNELPGCISQGDDAADAMKRIREAMELWIEGALKDGQPIPEPVDEVFSGKFIVRLPKQVHKALVVRAKREGVSLNLLAATMLARSVGIPS